jgi:RHS repeat-associated protein
VTGPDGARRSFGYEAAGALAAVTDAVGAVTAYTYDRAGHLATVTDPLGAVTLVESDGAGLPVRVTDATGASTTYERDETGRVVAVTDALGARTRLHYSLEGLPTARTGPDGAVESWRYDPQGNLVAHTTASGAVTRYAYGPFNCLTSRTDPDGTRLAFAYDKLLRLTSVTNPQGLVWSYSYDGSGRLSAETDFNGRTITYATDAAGRLVARTNGAEQTTTFERDVTGRVVERHTAEGRTTFGYDPSGRLTRATSPTADLVTTYDAAGRVVSEAVDGRTLRFSYDLAGRQVGRSTPTGVESTWTYGATGSPTALLAGPHTVTLSHDAVGNLAERRVEGAAGWQALRQEHDAAGRLVAQTVAGSAGTTVQRGFAYGPDGFLAAVTDPALGTRTVALDQVGRVNAVTGAGWQERYAYDAAGNLSSAAWPADDAEAQGERTYAGTRLRTAGRFRYEHDAQGRIVLRQRAQHSGKPLTWRYTWDSEDRLVAVRTPDGSRWTYRYDPLGRRLAKYRLAPGGEIAEQLDFTWDGSRLIEQTHHRFEAAAGPQATTWDYSPGAYTPLVQRERRWTSDTPQAEIDEHFYSIVADLVGNPTHLTATDGRVAWESRQTIWGTTTTVAGDGADCPLRLPGQYHDPETGHHYNNQRYYDPDTARYLSPDPLGLRSAPNPVAYVPNPTFEIDPLGLNATPVGPTPEQIQHAMANVGGLGEAQARMILTEAFKRGSSVVFGGSRVRGNYTPESDVDVGFGSLTNNQANKLIKKVNGVEDDPSWIRMEETKIIPGNETPNIPRIESPEEFFDRSGNRQPDDKGGAPYTGSGSHTYNPDGSISSRCPG